MPYYFAKTLDAPFDEAVERAIAALTRIDVRSPPEKRSGG